MEEHAIERHIVVVAIHPDLLASMLRGGGEMHYGLSGDIPEDARLLGATHDPTSNAFNLFFEHPSFPLCVDGLMPEMRPVWIKRID